MFCKFYKVLFLKVDFVPCTFYFDKLQLSYHKKVSMKGKFSVAMFYSGENLLSLL